MQKAGEFVLKLRFNMCSVTAAFINGSDYQFLSLLRSQSGFALVNLLTQSECHYNRITYGGSNELPLCRLLAGNSFSVFIENDYIFHSLTDILADTG